VAQQWNLCICNTRRGYRIVCGNERIGGVVIYLGVKFERDYYGNVLNNFC
jgi:hypothetical protein